MLKKIFYTPFIEAEREREQYTSINTSFDFKAVGICIYTAFALSVIYYWGQYELLRSFLLNLNATEVLKWTDSIFYDTSSNFGLLFYWILILNIFYFVIPALIIVFVFKEKFSDYGLKLKGAFKDYYIYILMLLIMIPLVLYFSGTRSFQDRYPFFHPRFGDSFPLFWKWEILYCTQFFTLEFFFRGFMVHGLKRRFGFYSVFIMTIPYCMIHFGKPMPETIAAIIAGIVLGSLSLKNKSIWLGFLIHCSVAITMDLASLWQKGLL